MENKQVFGTREALLLMMMAYIFSFAIRMIWVYQFHGNPNFFWNEQLMINTNDGYCFASGVQKVLFDMHADNPRIPSVWSYGVVALTVLLTKLTPFTMETIILYMPAIISSLVVVPIILITRLYKESAWGFFAALVGSITWSYYNRTMIGYYDTDMFSAMAPMFILYFLMKSTVDFSLKSALYAALAIAIYPFLYNSGASIVYAMGIIYALYLIVYHRNQETTYYSIILVFLALIPFPFDDPFSYILKIAVLVILYIFLYQRKILAQKQAMVMAGTLFILFMYYGNVFGLILSKIVFYTTTGTTGKGLHFYSVSQTIREAGKIPFEIFANRISGSIPSLIVAIAGYIMLVIRYRPFLLALPLVAIGAFAIWGGLRFTVYAVPIAAISSVYLSHFLISKISKRRGSYIFGMMMLVVAILSPNIKHIIGYRVPTVMKSIEVRDLDRLKQISSSKDYTIAWWDYGYPIWFYSNTNTIIDGAKHQNDNFIVSKIMQTDSPELAANLSRLAVETYVSSGYKNITDTLFKNGQKDQIDPNLLLTELESRSYKLPKKSREVYLYFPSKMYSIFPVVARFGNIDLTTGEPERNIAFYPTRKIKSKKDFLKFSNGIVFDISRGELILRKRRVPLKYFVTTGFSNDGKQRTRAQMYHSDGRYAVIYMQSYGQFIVMDAETFNSMYVQMSILGKYDKTLFELVVSSPYSKIYRVKR
ncbi:MAG: peptide-binding protein [Sulfurovum sp.]|nr:peptide-binding protein [Sulfurovum sp.]MCB4745580.1 peptide-binding protein [Sulfurovum sp.]MCB4747839.1 peptide-binding protein [Sulfurovum sp.]MCB4749205.1 peptide-binding protein [Sulfurovum sp.]MCB4750018.1 peptide-binding protein [Sulfurovum sp.]